MRILLAEDNPINQQVAAKMLRSRGHDVDVVENGRLAVEAVRSTNYDLVLMDVEMPEMGGLDATRAIRVFAPSGSLPIFALTAHSGEAEKMACLNAGMDEVVAKPFDPATLFALVEAAGTPASAAIEDMASMAAGAGFSTEGYPVDLRGFAEDLQRGGIEEMQREILATFVEDATSKLALIRTAFESGDGDGVRKAAHAYKSAAGTIHAKALHDALRSLEMAASEGNGLADLFDDVARNHNDALAYLKKETGD